MGGAGRVGGTGGVGRNTHGEGETPMENPERVKGLG
jgi:hypothetical protein